MTTPTNVPTNTDHIAVARAYFEEADDLCRNLSDGAAVQAAQVQATIGVGHALLALAQHFRYDIAPDVPISPERAPGQ